MVKNIKAILFLLIIILIFNNSILNASFENNSQIHQSQVGFTSEIGIPIGMFSGFLIYFLWASQGFEDNPDIKQTEELASLYEINDAEISKFKDVYYCKDFSVGSLKNAVLFLDYINNK